MITEMQRMDKSILHSVQIDTQQILGGKNPELDSVAGTYTDF